MMIHIQIIHHQDPVADIHHQLIDTHQNIQLVEDQRMMTDYQEMKLIAIQLFLDVILLQDHHMIMIVIPRDPIDTQVRNASIDPLTKFPLAKYSTRDKGCYFADKVLDSCAMGKG